MQVAASSTTARGYNGPLILIVISGLQFPRVGRTLLSDAFDVDLDLEVGLGLHV
jgi:hypothetical protein